MPKVRRQLPAILQQGAYYAIRSMLGALMTNDLGANIRAARSLARGYASLEKKRFERTVATLGVAFPEMPEEERRGHADKAYEHLFMLAVETVFAPRLLTRDGWSDHVRVGNLGSAIDSLLEGRPCILVTGHCGNWELLGYTLALLGFPLHALYRPLDLKPLDEWVRDVRQRRGLTLIDKFASARMLPRLIPKGIPIGFIADQNAGDRGLFVPFFNRMASTYKSIGLMALQFEAPIVCGQARRLVLGRDDAKAQSFVGFAEWSGEPFRYEIDVLDIIEPADWKGQPDPLFYVTARYRRALEAMVRRAPEQNLWLHRYWKSRPRHEHQGKPLPGALRDKLRSLPWMTDDDLARIEDWTARDARTMADSGGKNVPV